MGKDKAVYLTCVFFMVLHTTGTEVNGAVHPHSRSGAQDKFRDPQKLFVFGDSYADTGNLAKVLSPSWRDPYGITFPKKPSGRFSDGRVFTDYVASFLGNRSPIPYKYRKYGKKLFPYGMNFAVGGSGVFDTGNLQKNLTAQIDDFAAQVGEAVFPNLELGRSTAVVCISGNDYLYYQENAGGAMEGLEEFIPKVIRELKSDLKRIHQLGVGKIAVTNLHPIGCAPYMTRAAAHRSCNQTVNRAVVYHNGLLAEAVTELNMNATAAPFVVIDLFHAFTSVIHQEMKRSSDVLKPCCEGVSSSDSCGDVADGAARYTVCDAPHLRFYWDSVHPTQAGWHAASLALGMSLNSLLN